MCIVTTNTTTTTTAVSLSNNTAKTTMKRQRRRVVTFSQDVIAKETLHRNDYTQEEKESSFYTPRELSHMKHCTKLLGQKLDSMMMTNNIVEYPNATRGLEHFMAPSRRQIRASRQSVRNALLMEQNLQNYETTSDPEMIAMVCSDITRSSQLKAIQIAQIDEQYVRHNNIIHSDDDEASRTTATSTTTTAIRRRQISTKTIGNDDEDDQVVLARRTKRVKSNSTIRLFVSKAA